jgi:hypothetical protein
MTTERALAELIGRELRAAVAPLKARLEVLELHRGCEWKGIYAENSVYERGDLTTRQGGLWVCVRERTAATPGTDPNSWRLVVKSGTFSGPDAHAR